MFRSLTNIVKDVAEVTVKPVAKSVEMVTAPLAGAAKAMNDAMDETTDEMRKGFNDER